MPLFQYSGVKGSGGSISGRIDAESARAARSKLRAQNIFVTTIQEASELQTVEKRDVLARFTTHRVPAQALAVTTRQLATLINAGLPLVEALQSLAEQLDNQALQRIIVQLREDVEQGLPLAQSLGKYPRVFSRLYQNMVASGEASGSLDTVLLQLADYLEAALELRRRVTSALTYPIIMLIICSLVVIGLLTYVVPSIVEIFRKQGATLPLPTQIMLGISNALVNYWPLMLAFIGICVIVARMIYQSPRGRSMVDDTLTKLPIFGPMYVKVMTARVASTLASLVGSGVSLITALEITRNIVANIHLQRVLEESLEGVQQGRSLSKEIAKSKRFPTMLTQMIAVGEKSGDLEQMLAKAAKTYDTEVKASLAGLTSLIEPLMMVFVGGIVVSIVISVLLPMVDLIDIIQQ